MSGLWSALTYLVLGWGLIVVLARRRGEHRKFLYLLGGAFTLHLVIGSGLFLLATKANPVDPTRALADWLLASDAISYDQSGKYLATLWSGGPTDQAPLNTFLGGIGSYVVIVAALYSIFGPTPMAVIGFNALLIIPLGLGARRLALAVGQDRTAACILALLICLWPPALAWSSVILREIPCYVLIVWIMTLVIKLADDQGPFFRRPDTWVQLAVLLVLTYLLTSIRWYLGRILAPLLGLVLLWAVLRAGLHLATLRRLGRSVTVYLVVVAGVTLGAMYCLEFVALRLTPGLRPTQVSGGGVPSISLRKTLAIIVPSWSQLVDQHRGYKWNDQQARIRRMSRMKRQSGAAPATRSSYQYRGMLVRLFLFPYPWDQWPKSQANSPVRFLILAQTVFWYLLLAGLALGMVVRLKGLPWTTFFVAGWLFILGLALAYVVVNLGGLYRLRDLAILPALVLVDLRPYRWLWRRAGSWRRRHREPAADSTSE